jgi:DNA-binding GntR family transcriptional regulator
VPAPTTLRDGLNVAAVYERLREAIVRGEIPGGETSQAALARQLGVSRTPLREAIRMLQIEGLVITEPNRRLRITELSADDAEDLTVMRVAIEGVAIRLTVPVLGSRGIADLEGLYAQMEYLARIGDRQGYRHAHQTFHARLVGGAGERLTTSIAVLFEHNQRYQEMFGSSIPEVWTERLLEHRLIVDAAAAGDVDLSVRRLLEHYGRASAFVFERLGDVDFEPLRLRTALATLAPGTERTLDPR